jgi:hypothetical protein
LQEGVNDGAYSPTNNKANGDPRCNPKLAKRKDAIVEEADRDLDQAERYSVKTDYWDENLEELVVDVSAEDCELYFEGIRYFRWVFERMVSCVSHYNFYSFC